MKTRTRVNVAKALTLIELLIVVAIVAVLFAMLFPVRSGPRKSNRAACMRNLLFVDGHVVWKYSNLVSAIQNQGPSTNRLAMP